MKCLLFSYISISTWDTTKTIHTYLGLFKVYTKVYECTCYTKCKTYHLPYLYTQSLTTVVKIVGRSLDQKDAIRAYIKVRSKLCCFLKQLMTKLSTAQNDLLVCLMTQ